MLTKFNLYQPAAIDNSLNSYQIIHKIIHEINLIIDEINNIDVKANEYTDEQIRLLKAELQIKFNDVETMISGLSDRIDVTDSQIQGIFADLTNLRNIMNSNFDNIYSRINEVNTSLTLQIQNNYISLYHYIDSQIEMIMQLINTTSEYKVHGYNGKLMSIQEALDSIINNINLKSERISFGFITKRAFNDNEYLADGNLSLNVRVGDLTYKQLIDGLNATNMATSLYLTLPYSNTATTTSTLYPNFKEIIKKQLETTIFVFAITLAKYQNNTSYYNYTSVVCKKLNALGLGYGTNYVDVSSRYGDYYN